MEMQRDRPPLPDRQIMSGVTPVGQWDGLLEGPAQQQRLRECVATSVTIPLAHKRNSISSIRLQGRFGHL